MYEQIPKGNDSAIVGDTRRSDSVYPDQLSKCLACNLELAFDGRAQQGVCGEIGIGFSAGERFNQTDRLLHIEEELLRFRLHIKRPCSGRLRRENRDL